MSAQSGFRQFRNAETTQSFVETKGSRVRFFCAASHAPST
jgi:hypothetical protein